MQSVKVREDRLIGTMRKFFEQRKQDGVSRLNGELPRSQRKLMNSILRQARAIADA